MSSSLDLMMDLIHIWQSWSYKETLGILSVAIMFAAYGIYLRQTYLGLVLPHPLTWFLFGSTTLVTFCIQVSKNAGAGSWVMGLSSLICFVLFGYSWHKGRRLSHSPSDWIFFGGALVVLGFYIATVYVYAMDPTFSAIVATVADVVAYGPTISKGWKKPFDDSRISFLLNGVKFIPSLFALGPYSWATHLMPETLVIVNFGVAAMLHCRRSRLKTI